MMEPNDTIDYLLNQARTHDVAMEMMIMDQTILSLSHSDRKLEKYESRHSQSLGIRLLQDHHETTAWTEKTDQESLDQLFLSAQSMLPHMTKPFTPDLVEPAEVPSIEKLYNEALPNIPIEQKIAIVKEIEDLMLSADPSIKTAPENRYHESNGSLRIVNTKGVDLFSKSNSCSIHTNAIAVKDGVTKSEGDVMISREFTDLNPQHIVSNASARAVLQLDSQPISSGLYPIILENRVTASLLSLLAAQMTAKTLDEHTSYLAGSLGERIAPPSLNLLDNALLPEGFGTRPFDSEGAPSQTTTLIQDGIFQTCMTNSFYARKMGIPHTANAMRTPSTELDIGYSNLILHPGTHAPSAMVQAYPEVIVISSFQGMGPGFQQSSGNFSFQGKGNLYRNGERVHAVDSISIAGNIKDMFLAIEMIGDDSYQSPYAIVAPSMAVGKLSVASKT